MNPDAPPTTLPAARRHRRFLVLRLGVAAICVLLASILLVVSVARPPVGKVSRLTASERDQLSRPGASTRLKGRLKNWIAPVLRRFRKAQPIIDVDSQLFAVAPGNSPPGLPRPATTTADGARAWILPAPELDAFRRRLQNLPGATLLGAPRIHTVGGGNARLSSVRDVYVPWKSATVGFTIDVAPHVTGNSVRLIVTAISTETLSATNAGTGTIRTNFALSYQSWMGSQSGLVVDAGDAHDSQSNGFWFIVVPTILDEYGRPIR